MSAVRHRARTRARVIELYDAEWKPAEIQRVLKREGYQVPSRNTIWVWTHPTKASRQAKRDVVTTRRWRVKQASFAWPGVRTDAWKLGRMQAMRRAGVSYADIARVMRIDFPKDPPLTDEQVKVRVRGVVIVCAGCGGSVEQRRAGAVGRPRTYCDDCRPAQ